MVDVGSRGLGSFEGATDFFAPFACKAIGLTSSDILSRLFVDGSSIDRDNGPSLRIESLFSLVVPFRPIAAVFAGFGIDEATFTV